MNEFLAFQEFLQAGPDCVKGAGQGDCMISYLPLAHIYERIVQVS